MINMECEICGKPISDNPIRTKIDGSVMAVCKDCAKFGRIQKEPPKPKFQQKKGSKKRNNTSKKKYNNRDEPNEELVEDFNKIIRNAREAKNWSREKLGEEIYEKVSVINRIESGKMIPDIKLTKKLEKTLNITLLEKIDSIDLNQFVGESSNGLTLGNVMKIKRK